MEARGSTELRHHPLKPTSQARAPERAPRNQGVLACEARVMGGGPCLASQATMAPKDRKLVKILTIPRCPGSRLTLVIDSLEIAAWTCHFIAHHSSQGDPNGLRTSFSGFGARGDEHTQSPRTPPSQQNGFGCTYTARWPSNRGLVRDDEARQRPYRSASSRKYSVPDRRVFINPARVWDTPCGAVAALVTT